VRQWLTRTYVSAKWLVWIGQQWAQRWRLMKVASLFVGLQEHQCSKCCSGDMATSNPYKIQLKSSQLTMMSAFFHVLFRPPDVNATEKKDVTTGTDEE